MINRDSFLNLLRSESNDARYDISFCEKEIIFSKEKKREKGARFKEKRLLRRYISYLKKRKKGDLKIIKSLDKMIFLTTNLEVDDNDR